MHGRVRAGGGLSLVLVGVFGEQLSHFLIWSNTQQATRWICRVCLQGEGPLLRVFRFSLGLLSSVFCWLLMAFIKQNADSLSCTHSVLCGILLHYAYLQLLSEQQIDLIAATPEPQRVEVARKVSDHPSPFGRCLRIAPPSP
jgi:hypothetical protein